ncbi:MAG: hypothetical protein AAGM67_12695 [Bacteroidota bacterium]
MNIEKLRGRLDAKMRLSTAELTEVAWDIVARDYLIQHMKWEEPEIEAYKILVSLSVSEPFQKTILRLPLHLQQWFMAHFVEIMLNPEILYPQHENHARAIYAFALEKKYGPDIHYPLPALINTKWEKQFEETPHEIYNWIFKRTIQPIGTSRPSAYTIILLRELEVSLIEFLWRNQK